MLSHLRAPARVLASLLTFVVSVASFLVAPHPSPALADPGIGLTKSGPGTVLAGGTASYSLTASNPDTNPDAVPEYNLTFRDVLPAGVAYVPGSTSPAGAGEPDQFVDTDTGETTLVWSNVGDLQVGDEFTLGFSAEPDPDLYPVGASFTNTADAFAHSDPRFVPDVDAAGVPVPGSFTEFATDTTGATTVSAIRVDKTEPSPEGELLRGVHDHTTVYTITVTNNEVAVTTGVVLTDYLPAGLEYLGCGGVDNTTGQAPEYPGAPSLTGTPAVAANCLDPVSVSTVENPPPDGATTYPPGVYTRLEWDLGDLAPGQVATVSYAAGIPLRANTTAWPNGEPDPAGLGQTANLDNNTGPSTREEGTENGLTNIARASGIYTGPLEPGAGPDVDDEGRETVTVEDLRIAKTVSPGRFAAGGRAEYTLLLETSEYVSAEEIVIADVVPNGVCPLGPGGTNYVAGSPSECDGENISTPSVPFDAVTQNADGTFTVTFAPVGPIDASGTTSVTYYGRMRAEYTGGSLAGQPTASGDSFRNLVTLEGTTTPIPGTGEAGNQTVSDASGATQTTESLTLDKTIRPRTVGGTDCGTDGSGYGEPEAFAPDATRFRKGDLVCFKLRVDFSGTTFTRNPVVTDFLPFGTEYVAGSATATSNNSNPLVFDASAGILTWTVGAPDPGGATFAQPGSVFEVVFQVRVTSSASGPVPDILGNAMKLRTEDSSGRAQSFRDLLDFEVVPPTPVSILKGIQQVDDPAAGPNGPDVDGLPVREGSVVTFRIDVANEGDATAGTDASVRSLDIWDVLPPGVGCDDVTAITDGFGDPPAAGVCTDPGDADHPGFAGNDQASAIRWDYPFDPAEPDRFAIQPGETRTLTYDLTIPTPTSAGTVLDNTAHVRSYASFTNELGVTAEFFPQDNVDTTIPADEQDAPPASDPSDVFTPEVIVAKNGITSIVDTNNNEPDQATVGELVTYTYSVTIPPFVSVFDGRLVDPTPPPTGFQIVPGTPTVEYCPDAPPPPDPSTAPPAPCGTPAALPGGVTFDDVAGEVVLPAVYTNDTATAQRFQVTATALVSTDALTPAQNNVNRRNTARFRSAEAPGGSSRSPVTASYDVRVRQPRPVLTKTNTTSSPVVTGGTEVTYTLTASNENANVTGTGTNRTPLHDAMLVDCLPDGIGFVTYGPDPGRPAEPGDGANGCPTGTTRLAWDLGTLEPGRSNAVTRTYTATVEPDAVGGITYTNTATLTGGTLDDGTTAPNPDERTFAVPASSDITVAGAGIVKSVTPDELTIGETATWTISALVPADTNFFDAALIDRVPAGITNISLQTATCAVTGGGTCSFDGSALAPAPQPDGTTLYGWLIGDIPADPAQRTLTLTYTGRIDDLPALQRGDLLVNTAIAAWNTSDGPPPTGAGDAFDLTSEEAAATVTVVEPLVTISKGVSEPSPEPGQVVTYTVQIDNADDGISSEAYNGLVVDTVPTGVVVDPATIAGGGVLTGADPVTGGGIITWDSTDLPGPLPPGGTITLEYQARLAPSPLIDAAPLTNTVDLQSYESLPSGGRAYPDTPPADATVTPTFPTLTTTKEAVDGEPTYIGDEYTWRVTVRNGGTAEAFAVDVTDTLPPNWAYVPGSTTVTRAGLPAGTPDPIVAGQSLAWNDLGSILPGEEIVVTFRAVPEPDVVTTPGVGSAVRHVNVATSRGEDATGATGNLTGPYGEDTDEASTRIDAADLVIDKSHAGDPVAGETFEWTITVSNDGPNAAVGRFLVTDTVESPAGFVSATGTGWSCTNTGADVTCERSDITDILGSGGSFPPITLTVQVPADLVEGTVLSNTASVAGRTHDPDLTNNAGTDTAAVTTRADLAINKGRTGPVVPGLPLTYTLDVVNNGPSTSRGPITVTDTLPPGSTFVSASGTGWSCGESGGLVTCERSADLPAGQAAPQIAITVEVPSSQTAEVVNAAEVAGTTTDPDPGNNRDEDRGDPSGSADLRLQKSATGQLVAGATATYRLTVDNLGPSDAAPTVRITDALPAGLTYAGFTSITGTWDCSAAGQDVTCDLDGVLAADPGSLVAGDAIVEIQVAVASDVTGTIVNTAAVGSGTADPNPGNNTDTDSSEFTGEADLAVSKSHSGVAVAGSAFTWTISVANQGPSDTPGPIVVSDPLPAGVDYLGAAGTGWTCSETGGLVTCTSAAGLAAGSTADPISLEVLVDASAGPGTLVNTADVDGPITDPDTSNNSDSDQVTVVDEVELTLEKQTTGADPVRAGEATAFTIRVTNLGPSNADGILVTDALPGGLTAESIEGPGWQCDPASGPVITCRRDTLPPGVSVITVVARAGSGVVDGTVLTNTASVTTSSPGDDPADNDDTAGVTIIAEADLTITKTHDSTRDPVAAGEEVVFLITVGNEGPSDAAPDVTVVDVLDPGLVYVESNGPWTCAAGPVEASGQVLTCVLDGGSSLIAGTEAPPLTITTRVSPDAASGDYVNRATVSSGTLDPNPDNDTDGDTVPVTRLADVSITKSHTGPVRVGDELTFTLTVANAGPSSAEEIQVTDALPEGLGFVSASGSGWSCTESDAQVVCSRAAALAPGETAPPITVTVTVEAAAYPGVGNRADVTTETPEENLEDNTATDRLEVPPLVNLSVDKRHDGPFQAGRTGVWTLEVSNLGPTADPGPVTVTDALPAGVSFVSASGDGWSCEGSASLVTCIDADGLGVGETSEIALVVEVLATAVPGVTNAASVATDAEETDLEDNSDTDSVEIDPLVQLTIKKEVLDYFGPVAEWRITVANLGPNGTFAPIVVNDFLPEGLEFLSADGDGWVCTSSARLVTCQYDGVVSPGEAVFFDLVTEVTAPEGTSVTNVASIEGGGNVEICPTDSEGGVGAIEGCGLLGVGDAVIEIPTQPVPELPFTGPWLLLALLAGSITVIAGGLLLASRRREEQPHTT